MRIGLCCICKSLGNNGNFKTMTVKKATSMSESDRFLEIQNRTRQNFSNLYDIMKWNVENNIKMYRVSSSLCVLATHEICNYNYLEDATILMLADKIKTMAETNDIRLTIHISQYAVIATDKETVFQNTLRDLEYHCDLMELLGIKHNCIHVGSKKGSIEQAQERFVNNFLRLPERVQNSIMLENDDTSHNVESVLLLCETLNIPMVYDYHHDRLKPSERNVTHYIDRICDTWKDSTPISHISTSADDTKLVRGHHDYISVEDYNSFCDITNGKFDVEFEAKAKELAILKFI